MNAAQLAAGLDAIRLCAVFGQPQQEILLSAAAYIRRMEHGLKPFLEDAKKQEAEIERLTQLLSGK